MFSLQSTGVSKLPILIPTILKWPSAIPLNSILTFPLETSDLRACASAASAMGEGFSRNWASINVKFFSCCLNPLPATTETEPSAVVLYVSRTSNLS
ncbi:hypothetical protein Mapa_013881 [Marchantia paleacea]|nr:hypothetical protein Mapa_013881 [Marchantia paleacea]